MPPFFSCFTVSVLNAMRKIVFLILAGLLVMSACRNNEKRYKRADISDVTIEQVEILRYEEALFNLSPDNLAEGLDSLKKRYRFFLGDNPAAPAHIKRMRNYLEDPLLKEIYATTREKYKTLNNTEKELTRMFRYFKYYFPNKETPEVYTYISGIDYRRPIQYYDSVMIIALDMYLGSDFDAYRKVNIPHYKTQTFNKEYISVDAANSIAETLIEPRKPEGRFIDHMIHYGKRLYFKDALLPNTPGHLKIKYTPEQLKWCQANEKNIWTFMVENDLLFSGKYNDFKKLLSPGPFTSEFGKESAPRIGRWVGWQIARGFMNNNPDISLEQFMKLQNSQKILKQSKYKP